MTDNSKPWRAEAARMTAEENERIAPTSLLGAKGLCHTGKKCISHCTKPTFPHRGKCHPGRECWPT